MLYCFCLCSEALYVQLDIFSALVLKIAVLFDMIPCILVQSYHLLDKSAVLT
jgi:hypothetical protein